MDFRSLSVPVSQAFRRSTTWTVSTSVAPAYYWFFFLSDWHTFFLLSVSKFADPLPLDQIEIEPGLSCAMFERTFPRCAFFRPESLITATSTPFTPVQLCPLAAPVPS